MAGNPKFIRSLIQLNMNSLNAEQSSHQNFFGFLLAFFNHSTCRRKERCQTNENIADFLLQHLWPHSWGSPGKLWRELKGGVESREPLRRCPLENCFAALWSCCVIGLEPVGVRLRCWHHDGNRSQEHPSTTLVHSSKEIQSHLAFIRCVFFSSDLSSTSALYFYYRKSPQASLHNPENYILLS